MLDRNQVELFCNVAAGLLTTLATYGGTPAGERDPADDTLVRQLRVAGGAINEALNQVARLTPPQPLPMPPPPGGSLGTGTPPAPPATSTGG